MHACQAIGSLLLVSVLFWNSGQSSAQEGAPPIDLQSAVARAVADNPALRAAGIQMQLQDARIEQAGIKPRPQLEVEVEDVFGSGTNDMLSGIQTTASVSWVLEQQLRESRLSAARAGSSLVQADIEIRRLDVAAATALLYLDCLALQTRETIAEEAIVLAEAAIAAIELRVNAGTTPIAELSRARAFLRRQELAADDIEHELLSAYYRLASQWGASEPDFSSVRGDLLNVPAMDSFESFALRLEQNPDLERFLSAARVYEAELRLEEARNRQPWHISGGVRWQNKTSDHGFVAGITIPLGPQDSNRGRVAEARTRITQSRLEREAEQLRLQTELFVIYQELVHYFELTAAFTDDILPLYESALIDTRAAYDAGRYSYLEWNQTQIDLLTARSERIDAAHSIYRNLIEIERLTGVSAETSSLSQ